MSNPYAKVNGEDDSDLHDNTARTYYNPQDSKLKNCLESLICKLLIVLMMVILVLASIGSYYQNKKIIGSLNDLDSSLKSIKSELNASSKELIKHQFRIINDKQGVKKGQLPLFLPFINQNNQMVEEVLYTDERTRNQRVIFNNDKIELINSRQDLTGLALAKHNMILTVNQYYAAKAEFDAEWQRLQQKFQLSKVTEELSMCLIVPGYNNNANFRIQYNLNSIFTQNYSNYKAIIINDASNDGSDALYRRYFDFYGIDPAFYTYVQNTARVTAVQNIYFAAIKYCSNDSILVIFDSDDELIGRNALKVFNWGYQTKKSGVLYSNFYSHKSSELWRGFTSEYTEQQKKNNLYRDVKMKFSHLRSCRAQLFLKINPKDLKTSEGEFYKVIYDLVIFFPLMELSCGRVDKIDDEFHYLYNMGTGLNDYDRGDDLVAKSENIVRSSKKYQCSKEFDDKMKLLP